MRRREVLTAAGTLAGALAAGVAGLRAVPASAGTIWKAADISPPGYPTVAAVDKLAARLADATKGRLTLKLYPDMQLGNETRLLHRLQAGDIQMARLSSSVLGRLVDDLNVFHLPFLFRNTAHMEAMIDGPVGGKLLDSIAAVPEAGVVGLCWFDAGARNFYDTKRPIRAIADMKGLRIRVMDNPIFVDMVDALGGVGIPLPYGEVLDALRSGKVDGAENSVTNFVLSKHFEVAHYYSLTEHLIIPDVLVFGRRDWDALAPDDQALVKKLAREAQLEERELWVASEQAAMKKVQAAKVEIIPVADKRPFQQAVKPVWDKYGDRYKDLVRQIEEVG